MNLLIEGLPGAGKSTLLTQLERETSHSLLEMDGLVQYYTIRQNFQ